MNYKELSEESRLVSLHLIRIFPLSHHIVLVLPLRVLLSLDVVSVWLLNPVWMDFQPALRAARLAAQNAGQDAGVGRSCFSRPGLSWAGSPLNASNSAGSFAPLN